jgi:YegS/Rv2252/BmrU family lipid kinase
METLLLANPAAGGGRAGRDLAAIVAAARAWWPDLLVATTAGPGKAGDLARFLATQGARTIIVIGGDGTVHEAANGVLALPQNLRPRLGVVPIGTGNDFAKLIGTGKQSPRRALEILAGGQLRRFDVGLAWGEYFVNSLGLGFDAAVASRVPRFRRLWRPLVYPAAMASSYFKFTPIRGTVVTDAVVLEQPLFGLEVAVGVSAGGGFYLTPDAKPDDGLFDVCAVGPLNLWKFLTRMPTAFWGGHVRFKEVQMLRTRSVNVLGAKPLLAHLDGEIRSGGHDMRIEILPGALPVLAV